MTEETVLFALFPLAECQPLVWCIVAADTEPEARRTASEQCPEHLQVDWLAPDAVECRRVIRMGGSAPSRGAATYYYERADIAGAER
jgi:hypothetical protein